MSIALGLDTSNYTTSVAYFDGQDGQNVGQLLDVPEGMLGLRQSDALFSHVKRLPALTAQLLAGCETTDIGAVGASTRPREVEGSYMPCFLAGESQGRTLAQVLHVPFFSVSHQQGHIAAAAFSAKRLDLLETPHLAWHLSGGTTELLYIEPDGPLPRARQIGGTTDISAGQLVDRTGKHLGLPFPAGKALDALSQESEPMQPFRVKVKDAGFSLSGLENQMHALAARCATPNQVSRFVLESILFAVRTASQQALAMHPGLPLLCAGGVSSNRLLREGMTAAFGALFAEPAFATDNAFGVALLAARLLERGATHE